MAAQNDNLSIHEDKTRGVYVKGLTDVYVGSEAEVFKVMKAGGASRATSSTSEAYSGVSADRRYERRVFEIPLDLCHWYPSTQHRDWIAKVR